MPNIGRRTKWTVSHHAKKLKRKKKNYCTRYKEKEHAYEITMISSRVSVCVCPAVHTKSKLTVIEKGETCEEQSQERGQRILSHQGGLFTKNSSWQAKQPIPHTNLSALLIHNEE
jgi:hypothetical protein